jgi:MFS family permease
MTTDHDTHAPSKKPLIPKALLLCLLLLLIHMTLTGGRISVMLTGLSMGMSSFYIGLVISAFALLPMFMSVRFGRLVDAIGPYKPMRAAAISTLIGITLPFIWQHWFALGLAAVFIGLGHMAFQLTVQEQIGLAQGETRLKHFSWLSLSLSVSGFSGPLIAGLSIDHLGHRYVFALLAVAPLIAIFGVYKIRAYLIANHTPTPKPEVKPRIKDLMAIKPLRQTFIANLLLAGAWDTHLFLVPIYGVQRDLSATTIGIIMSSFALATLLVRLALPIIRRFATPWQMVHIAMVTAGLNFLLYPWFTDTWVLMSLSFVLGLSLGCTQPNILFLLRQTAPSDRSGEVFGLRMAFINGSQVALPLAFGAVGVAVGLVPLFATTAVAITLGAWFTRHADRQDQPFDDTTRPKRSTPPPS